MPNTPPISKKVNKEREEFYKMVERYEKFAETHIDTAFLGEMFDWHQEKMREMLKRIKNTISHIEPDNDVADCTGDAPIYDGGFNDCQNNVLKIIDQLIEDYSSSEKIR